MNLTNKMILAFILLYLAFGYNITLAQNPIDSLGQKPQIRLVSSLKLPDVPLCLFLLGNYCYIANSYAGLQIVDISNDIQPVLVGGLSNLGAALRVVVKDSLAYVASGDSGLQIIIITDKTKPKKLAGILWEADDIAIHGNYVYMVDKNQLNTIDISNPLNPIKVSNLDYFGYSTTLAIKENYAFSLDCHYQEEYCTLRIIDISNPSRPDTAASFDRLEFWDKIIIDGNYMYVAGFNDGLRIFDISRPTKPRPISHFATPGDPLDFFVLDGFVFLTETWPNYTGIQVINAKDPKSPYIIASYELEKRPRGIFVRNELIYVGVEGEGLLIFQLEE